MCMALNYEMKLNCFQKQPRVRHSEWLEARPLRNSATRAMRTEASQSVGATKAQIFILHSLHQRYPAIITQDYFKLPNTSILICNNDTFIFF